jgi:hypothetical protein
MPRRKILRTPQRYLEPRTAIQLPTAAQLCVRAVTQGAMDKIDEAAAQLPPRLTPEPAALFVADQLGFPVSPLTLKRAPIPR